MYSILISYFIINMNNTYMYVFCTQKQPQQHSIATIVLPDPVLCCGVRTCTNYTCCVSGKKIYCSEIRMKFVFFSPSRGRHTHANTETKIHERYHDIISVRECVWCFLLLCCFHITLPSRTRTGCRLDKARAQSRVKCANAPSCG